MRPRKACDICYRSKIKCDKPDSDTACNWCGHHNLSCTFTRTKMRRKDAKPKKSSLKQHISRRLEALEESVAQMGQQHQLHTLTRLFPSELPAHDTSAISLLTNREDMTESSSSRSLSNIREKNKSSPSPHLLHPPSPFDNDMANVAFNHIHFDGSHLGKVGHHNGMPVLSEDGRRWISSRTGEEVSFHRFATIITHQPQLSKSFAPFLHLSSEELYELPDQTVVEMALRLFEQSPCRLVFPILDPILFKDTISKAYTPLRHPLSLENVTARCCVLAFLSIVFLFRGTGDDHPHVDTDACAFKAYHLLTYVLEGTSLVSLQAVHILHIQHMLVGRVQSAAMLHSIACRSLFILGGHVYRPIQPYKADATRRERESRQLRLLFWLCYLSDKDVALRLSQPPLLSDEYCDLTLPEGYSASYLFRSQTEDTTAPEPDVSEDAIPHLPGDVALSQLKDKTARLLYSARAARKTEAELFQDVRELDDELEQWRISIPPQYRPCLSISHESQPALPDRTIERSMRCITLHLEYHHLMTTIHRVSGRCSVVSPENRHEDGALYGGVQSSIALTLEASRSTLIFLKAAIPGLAGQAFWALVFYPTVAIMTLFLNVLQHPLDPQAKRDLEILGSAAEVIRRMPVWRLTPHEIGHMQLIDKFVAELVRLGNCAILQETRKQGQGTGESQTTK